MKTLKKISVTIFAVMMISSVTVANAQQSAKSLQLKKGMSQIAEMINHASGYLSEIFYTAEDGNLMEYTGENSPLLKDWMLNSGLWNANEAESMEAVLEDWMLNTGTWNNNESETPEVKNWMLSTTTWGLDTTEVAETEIEPAGWMLCPELMAPAMNTTITDNDVPVADWMLQTSSWAK